MRMETTWKVNKIAADRLRHELHKYIGLLASLSFGRHLLTALGPKPERRQSEKKPVYNYSTGYSPTMRTGSNAHKSKIRIELLLRTFLLLQNSYKTTHLMALTLLPTLDQNYIKILPKEKDLPVQKKLQQVLQLKER